MSRMLRFKIPKIYKILNPTIEEMKRFAKDYSLKQWDDLTNNKEFIKVFTENLNLAKLEANKVLNK